MLAIIIILLMFCLVMFVATNSSDQILPLYRLQLTLTKFITLIIFAALVSLFQFFSSIPLFILLVASIYILKLRNKVGIMILGAFLGFCCMVVAVTIVIYLRHAEHDSFAGLAYVYGLIPSILTGGGLGLYLASQVKEETEETPKRRILWFIYISAEKPWSSKD